MWEPTLDLSETETEFVVRLAAPGMTRDDLDVWQERRMGRGDAQDQDHHQRRGGHMKVARCFLAVPLALFGAVSLSAQANGRAVVFQAFGGGATHLRNLNATGPVAHFEQGWNIGGAIGVQANDYIGLHADFTYTRNVARGTSIFTGAKFNRYFYGAHVEVSYPTESRFAPFAFAGGGAVTVHQVGASATLLDFTKPAAMFGAGLRYQFGSAPVELLMEGKSLVYQWDGGGFTRTQWDLSYSLGLAYRLGF
jgi:hypothetical protein